MLGGYGRKMGNWVKGKLGEWWDEGEKRFDVEVEVVG